MKISTKGRYALRLLLELASCEEQQYLSLKEIARRQSLSVKYMEQIIALLAPAGLVTSARGPQGGYRLAKKLSEISVGQVLRLTEGSLSIVTCEQNHCGNCDTCATYEVWRRLEAVITAVVDPMTLADLKEIERQKKEGCYGK